MQKKALAAVMSLLLAATPVAGTALAEGVEDSPEAPVSARALPVGATRPANEISRIFSGIYTHGGYAYASQDIVNYYVDSNNMLNILEYEAGGDAQNIAFIHTYDNELRHQRTGELALSNNSSLNGFHQDENGFLYLLLGYDTQSSDGSAKLFELRQYDQSWKLNKSLALPASMFGTGHVMALGNTGNISTSGGKLYFHAGAAVYSSADSRKLYGRSLEVNLADMSYRTIDSYEDYSFNRFTVADGNDVIVAEHTSKPFGISYAVVDPATGQRKSQADLFKSIFPSSLLLLGTDFTDLGIGRTKNLLVGISAPHNNPVQGVTGNHYTLKSNIFAISVDKANADGSFNYSFKWLTDFHPNGNKSACDPRLIQLDEDRFIMMYSLVEDNRVSNSEYVLLDSSGNVLARKYLQGVTVPAGAQPIIYNGRLVFIAWSDGNKYYFYELDISNPHDPQYMAARVTNDGWVKQGGKWYYYDSDTRVKGWLPYRDSGTSPSYWYYLDRNTGEMKTGWLNEGYTAWGTPAWYLLNHNTGRMTTEWAMDGGKWYYFNSSGQMINGWLKDGANTYHFQLSGVMTTGWLSRFGGWCYFDPQSGAMATGWKAIGGTWYWFDAEGMMATGTRTIGGKTYRFSSSGAWIA